MPEYNYSDICSVLKNGGLVAVPTDTVFGLAVDPENPNAVKKLYDIKSREARKPLVYMVYSVDQLKELVVLTDEVRNIISKYWPGALTVIFQKKHSLETVGYRIPDNKFMLELLTKWGRPLGVTSANISEQKELSSMQEIKDTFGMAIDHYVFNSDKPSGIASTIIDAAGKEIKILRQGAVKI